MGNIMLKKEQLSSSNPGLYQTEAHVNWDQFCTVFSHSFLVLCYDQICFCITKLSTACYDQICFCITKLSTACYDQKKLYYHCMLLSNMFLYY